MTSTAPAATSSIDWAHYPAVTPPPGYQSNWVDPPSQAKYDTITQSVCLSLCTLLLAMRLYTKILVLHSASWDDYLAIPAWAGICTFGALALKADAEGHGKYVWDITPLQYVSVSYWVYFFSIVYCITMLFLRSSILLLYIRIFRRVRISYWIFQGVLWFNLAYYIGGIFTEAFACTPIRKSWWPLLPGHCLNQRNLQIASTSINFTLDIITLVLPIVNVWQLKTAKAGKAGLIVIFGFGIFGCIASGVRVGILARTAWDAWGFWKLYPLLLWATAEMSCGFICGCLSTLPAFLRHVGGVRVKFMASATRSQNGKSSRYGGQYGGSVTGHTANGTLTGDGMPSSRGMNISSPVGPTLKGNSDGTFDQFAMPLTTITVHPKASSASSQSQEDQTNGTPEWSPVDDEEKGFAHNASPRGTAIANANHNYNGPAISYMPQSGTSPNHTGNNILRTDTVAQHTSVSPYSSNPINPDDIAAAGRGEYRNPF